MLQRKLKLNELIDALYDGESYFQTYSVNSYPLLHAIELTCTISIDGKVFNLKYIGQIVRSYETAFSIDHNGWLYHIVFKLDPEHLFYFEEFYNQHIKGRYSNPNIQIIGL